jgi:predicted  nucleic acid-binding Zn-ribbon protein
MKETIQGLLKLREIDEKLAHLHRRIDDGPRILSKREAEFQESGKSVEEKKETIQASQLSSKEREVQLKSLEEDIKKQDAYLLGAKTNEEYRALQDQIGRLRDQVGELEEEILASYDLVEEEKKVLAEMERELGIQKDEFEEFKKNIENDLKEYNAEIDMHLAKRQEMADEIHFEAVQLYNKVKKARGGDGIVSADGQTCGGCYMTVTTNDLARLRGMNEIVLCKFCQRILYLSDLLA